MMNQAEIAKEINLKVGEVFTSKNGGTRTISRLTEKSAFVIATNENGYTFPENRESYNSVKTYIKTGSWIRKNKTTSVTYKGQKVEAIRF